MKQGFSSETSGFFYLRGRRYAQRTLLTVQINV